MHWPEKNVVYIQTKPKQNILRPLAGKQFAGKIIRNTVTGIPASGRITYSVHIGIPAAAGMQKPPINQIVFRPQIAVAGIRG